MKDGWKIKRVLEDLPVKIRHAVAQSPQIDSIRDSLRSARFLDRIFVAIRITSERHVDHTMFLFTSSPCLSLSELNPDFPAELHHLLHEYLRVIIQIATANSEVMDLLKELTARYQYWRPVDLLFSEQAEVTPEGEKCAIN